MNTPVVDFLNEYAERDSARFHMPGHKGVSSLGCEGIDITEVEGADVLYSPSGIIAESEENATRLFGTRHTYYSTEGSTLAIKAMLALIKKRGARGEKTVVLAARNAHKSFLYACALLDMDIKWLCPTVFEHLCSCKVGADELSAALDACQTLPCAVYITSPDYLGNTLDIAALSRVCHERGIPLLVDNAHGAYLAFTEPSLHPIALGADMCADSAHKTLPVLTGGAYLHIAKGFDVSDKEARSALSLFASTSPSYLTLASLDLCNACLAADYPNALRKHIEKLHGVRENLASLGFPCENSEPLKLVFFRASCGYGGEELAKILRENKIEPEFFDCDALVLMSSPQNSNEDLEKLLKVFERLPKRAPERLAPPRPEVLPSRLSVREAILSPSETVPTEKAVGRICASPTVSCPPAVPIVMSGEEVTERAQELMLYYGINEIEVVK